MTGRPRVPRRLQPVGLLAVTSSTSPWLPPLWGAIFAAAAVALSVLDAVVTQIVRLRAGVEDPLAVLRIEEGRTRGGPSPPVPGRHPAGQGGVRR